MPRPNALEGIPAVEFVRTFLPTYEGLEEVLTEHGLGSVPVRFNPRLRVTAGRCLEEEDGRPEVHLNPALWRESADAVRDTLLHELAHALAGVRDGHGRTWRRACRALGIPGASRCHQYPHLLRRRLHRPRGRKLAAYCRHCEHQWHKRRYYTQHATYSRCPVCGHGPLVTRIAELQEVEAEIRAK